MADRPNRLHVNVDGTASVELGSPLPPGEYYVQLTDLQPILHASAQKAPLIDRLPRHDVPWHDSIPTRREDMYD